MKTKRPIDWLRFFTHGGLLYLVLAVVCLVGAGLALSNSSGIDSWPSTRGIVTMSYVDTGIPDTSRRNTQYQFAYEYRVDGKTYRSDRYSYASVGGERSVGVKRYKEGDRVTVFYNPQNPAAATLVRQGPGVFVYIVLFFGVLFLLAATGSMLTGEAFALFSRSGWVEMWEQWTNRREQAIERVRKVATRDDPEALVNALQDPLLRECLHYLADTQQVYSSRTDRGRWFRLENAAQHLHKAAGIGLKTTREMMRLLAQRQGIDLGKR